MKDIDLDRSWLISNTHRIKKLEEQVLWLKGKLREGASIEEAYARKEPYKTIFGQF